MIICMTFSSFFFSSFVCLITANCPQTDIKLSSFLLSHSDLFFWAQEINGSTFPVSGCKQPAYGCSESDRSWMSTVGAWHRYAKWTGQEQEQEKLSSFICINKHFPIVARQTFNHRSSPNNQKRALLIKPALFIIRHLTGTLQYNNTLLLHNSCMVSLPLTSPSNYALKSTNARAVRWLVYMPVLAGKNHISLEAHLGNLIPAHISTVVAWWGFFWC